jgi:hypothetical protein
MKFFFIFFFFWWSLTIQLSLWRFFFFFSSFSYLLVKCLATFIPIGILFFYLKSNDLKEKKNNNVICLLSLFNFYLASRNSNETLHTISKMNCHLRILKLLTITLVLIFMYSRWRYHTLIEGWERVTTTGFDSYSSCQSSGSLWLTYRFLRKEPIVNLLHSYFRKSKGNSSYRDKLSYSIWFCGFIS